MLASNFVRLVRPKAQALFLAAALPFCAAAAAAAPRHARRVPAFTPGETLRYRIEYRSRIASRAAGPITTPESAHRLDLSLSAVLRLAVLAVTSTPKRGRETRMRVTYESCDARVTSDAYDPGAEALEKQYESLRGHSFEFSIDARGRTSDVTGLDGLVADPGARAAIRRWLDTLTLPIELPRSGMKPGGHWTRLTPVPGAPLAGLAWRTRSVFRQNEPCPPAPGAPAALRRQTCAVISTTLRAVRGKHHGDTPLAYGRKGLRTHGSWQAQGESLTYVSLATGLVTGSTSTETNDVDVTITSALSGSRLRYAGKSESSSQITLVGLRRAPTGASPRR